MCILYIDIKSPTFFLSSLNILVYTHQLIYSSSEVEWNIHPVNSKYMYQDSATMYVEILT